MYWPSTTSPKHRQPNRILFSAEKQTTAASSSQNNNQQTELQALRLSNTEISILMLETWCKKYEKSGINSGNKNIADYQHEPVSSDSKKVALYMHLMLMLFPVVPFQWHKTLSIAGIMIIDKIWEFLTLRVQMGT